VSTDIIKQHSELKNIVALFLFASLCLAAFGQGEIDTQEKMLFQNERSISVSLNSNGFGAGYRFGKRKTYLNKTLFDIGFAYIKHPKEVKISPPSSYYNSSRRYVNGKTNLFVNLRPSIGFQREIFSKEDKGSIAVKYYYGAGPSIGLSKPIYYTFNIYSSDYRYAYSRDEKYKFVQDPVYKEIAGRASFWKGFDELAIYPGLHVNAGLSFEYGSVNQLINAIDVSATFDAFYKKIPIMYTQYNSQFFLTLSLSYRFGWVVEKKYKAPKITREGKRLSE
jgi:hypothetical protein